MLKEKSFGFKAMLAVVIGLGIVLAVLTYLAANYHLVDGVLYERSATYLDLRGKEITSAHYAKLKKVFPDCEIRWNIPFQGTTVRDDATEVTLTELSKTDVVALASLKNLTKVNAVGCTDYENLLELRAARPDVTVKFFVELGGKSFDSQVKEIGLSAFYEEDLENLAYLTNLDTIVLMAGKEPADFADLITHCLDGGIDVELQIGTDRVRRTARSLTIEGLEEQDLFLLDYLENLNTLHLVAPKASPETVFALEDKYPNVTWEVDLFGELIPNDDVPEEIDLSKVTVDDLEELEQAMRYLPDAKTIFLGKQKNLDNEDIAQFRERVREDYKVVWTVTFGTWTDAKKEAKQSVRTDIEYFFPAKAGVGIEFFDDPNIKDPKDCMTWNLRYCEDVLAVDVGHLGVRHTDWLEGMPKLKYLILAHTQVQDIEGIENCKELLFLELDWSPIKKLDPLVQCTKLEDLNIGNAWPDVTPLKKMTWLKNLYMIYGDRGDAWELTQALPNTHVVVSGNATVGSGWRNLQNYYDMRDTLQTYYMEG